MADTRGDAFAFRDESGEMSRLIRAHDWRATSLGDPSSWPEVLHTLVGVMVSSSQPMFIVWGPDRTTLYNDSYAEVLAGKHPALGRRFEDIWHEIWDADLKPIVERAYSGEALHMDDIPLMMMRKGYREETHFSFSYTPVRGPDGEVHGFFCPCLEITEQVLEERRARLRADLTERLRTRTDIAELAFEAAGMLASHLRAGQAAFAEIDPDGAYAVIERDWTDGSMESNAGRHRLEDFGPAFIADLQAGRIIAVHDVSQDPRTCGPGSLKTFKQRGIGAFINIPLMREGRLGAVLAVHSRDARCWRDADIAFAAETANRIFTAAEQARAEAARRASEQRLRTARDELALATSASQLSWGSWDLSTGEATLDARGREMLDLAGDETRIDDWIARIHPDDRARVLEEIDACVRDDRPFDIEYRVVKRDGTERIAHATGTFEGDAAGAPRYGTGFIRDITERRRAEQHQTMLMAELDHRVKNILALIQSIARQTLGRETDATQRFMGRISALAQSHMLLADSRWEGAGLVDLVETAAAAYQGEAGDRISIGGPDIKLNPKAAQTLTLALHELVTNAAKYGALSKRSGRVDAHWAVEGEGEAQRLRFVWRESGGPPLRAEPDRKGFGSFLIEQALAYELRGEVSLEYAREGLRAAFDLPLPRLRAFSGSQAGAADAGA
ncbi:MAG: HWE histidine kinase domain-containing protein [Oceanicaulis sp.]